jgi:LysR family transcriptional activator of nhaA
MFDLSELDPQLRGRFTRRWQGPRADGGRHGTQIGHNIKYDFYARNIEITDEMAATMNWLNYHHLYYFWTVAREGSVARACDRLLLCQPTISGQIRALERSFGVKLFRKVGRNLALTDAGREVYRYADGIFTLGHELQDAMRGLPVGRHARLGVGIPEAFPKMVSCQILEPALRRNEYLQVVCHEAPPEHLLAQLALHQLDMILADTPAPPTIKVRAFNHLLGECGVSFCAAPRLARAYLRTFPRSLNGAPFLLPLPDTALRRSLDHWMDQHGIRPNIRGEFADSALLKTFGETGAGVFVVPTAIETHVCRQYRVRVVGREDAIRERFYLISVERKLKQPLVATIADLARKELFA